MSRSTLVAYAAGGKRCASRYTIDGGRLRGGRSGALPPTPPPWAIAPWNPNMMWSPGEISGADGSGMLSYDIAFRNDIAFKLVGKT